MIIRGFELSKIVATYNAYIGKGPKDLEIEVVEYPSGKFSAKSNYSYWGPDQADAYQNNNPCDRYR